MDGIGLGINLEYVRHEDRSFAFGIETAREIGYTYVEPCLLNGRDLLAEAEYYHFRSMDDDPLEVKEQLDSLGLKASGVSAHAPLMRPDVGVQYLQRAIRYASDLGAPVVNTDEGIRPGWMTEDQAFELMRYSLTVVLRWAERYGIMIGLEPHGVYTTKVEGLLRILNLVDSPMFRVNFDTGNSYLAGSDPYKDLEAVAGRVVHVHAKDIGGVLLDEVGKVTGTPAGVACGEGIIDWSRIVGILRKAGYQGVLSVECGTIAQARTSFEHLNSVLRQPAGAPSR